MRISFIILNYNQEDLLQRCVNSIIFSGIPSHDYEIIMVDDGSNDGSISLLNKQFKNIKVYYTDINKKNTKNQSLGRNIGISKANGDYIRFLDGDDYFNSFALLEEYKKINSYDVYFVSSLINALEDFGYIKIHEHKINMYDGVHNLYIKREILLKNDIYFDEIKHNWYFEDLYFYFLVIDCMFNNDLKNNFSSLDNPNLFSYIYNRKLNTNSNFLTTTTQSVYEYLNIFMNVISDIKNKITNEKTLLELKEVEYLQSTYISYYINNEIN